MTDQPVPDWEAFLRRHDASGVVELDLGTVQPGDRLLVVTQNTVYSLVMLEAHEAMLTSNRTDRPSGRVRINGGTFGLSSSIKPDHLFCGGNLEIVHSNGREIFTTTEIRGLQLLHAEPAAPRA